MPSDFRNQVPSPLQQQTRPTFLFYQENGRGSPYSLKLFIQSKQKTTLYKRAKQKERENEGGTD